MNIILKVKMNDYFALVNAAVDVRRYSIAPYSNFSVGAALLTRDGKIYTGCNIESSSLGLTICAERVALFKALSEGERDFTAVAISTSTGEACPPCGACRQVLLELAGNIDVLSIYDDKKYTPLKLEKLLPKAFTNKFIKRDR